MISLGTGDLLKGRYRIESQLGRGGMGAVYRAFDILHDEYCALKEFRLAYLPSEDDLAEDDATRPHGQRRHRQVTRESALAQFRIEAKMLAELDHPHLPKVRDYFSDGDSYYLVMELIEGDNLANLMHDKGYRPFPEEQVLAWIEQVGSAVAYCHQAGVIHRDIKPANLILAPSGKVYLVDFGTAKADTGGATLLGSHTPGYSPPEQYGSGTVRRSDIYAMGATMYTLLSGQVPLDALDRVAGENMPAPRTLVQSVSPQVNSAIMRAMEIRIEDRFESIADMLAALKGSGRPAWKRGTIAAGVALAALVVLGVWGLPRINSFTPTPTTTSISSPVATDVESVGIEATFTETAALTSTTASVSVVTPIWSPLATRAISTAPMATIASSATAPIVISTPSPTQSATATATATDTVTLTPSSTPSATHSRLPTRAIATDTNTPPPSPTLAVQTSSEQGDIAFAVYNPDIASYTLYTVNPDGSGLHRLADYVHQPEYSHDGTQIVVNGVGGGKDDIWSFKRDGSEWRQVTQHPDDHFPIWSPNSKLVAFSSTRQGDGIYRLYSGDSFVPTDVTKYIMGDYPLWLPSWEIIFQGCDYGWGTGAKCGLWRVSEGNRPSQVTDNPQDIPSDAAATEMLFLRPADEDWDIYRIGLGGGNSVRLTDSPGRDGPAAFSPDLSTIAFLSDRSGAWALFTMNRQGTALKKVLDLPMGGNYDAAPDPWTAQRLSWGPPPFEPPQITPTPEDMLTAPQIIFPIPYDTVSSSRSTTVRWTWSGELAVNQGFDVRFWHLTDSVPAGVAPPTEETELEVSFGATETYQRNGEGYYYLDVVVVQIDPYKALSRSAPIQVKTDPSK